MDSKEETRVMTFRIKRSLYNELENYLKREDETLSNVLNNYLEQLVKGVNTIEILEDEKILKLQKQLLKEIRNKMAHGIEIGGEK